MAAWSLATKPTPANIRKRLDSAHDALDAALQLAQLHPTLGKQVATPVRHAMGWCSVASQRTGRR